MALPQSAWPQWAERGPSGGQVAGREASGSWALGAHPVPPSRGSPAGSRECPQGELKSRTLWRGSHPSWSILGELPGGGEKGPSER